MGYHVDLDQSRKSAGSACPARVVISQTVSDDFGVCFGSKQTSASDRARSDLLPNISAQRAVQAKAARRRLAIHLDRGQSVTPADISMRQFYWQLYMMPSPPLTMVPGTQPMPLRFA